MFAIIEKNSSFNILPTGEFRNSQRSFLSSTEASVIFPENPTIEGEAFLSYASPLNISLSSFAVKTGNDFLTPTREPEIKTYIVKKGDTISSIAKHFDISVNTILWANNLSSRSLIKPGQKLIILPVSGVLHLVKKGDTISSIAKRYQVSKQEIISFNRLSKEGKIYIGDLLIIPGGKMPTKVYSTHRDAKRTFSAELPPHYFICPIPAPCRITQGLHWYNAVDFSNGTCGEPVYAVAGGIVQRTGYHRIAGNYIRIIHPNGVVTFYGHLSKILVRAGQRVSQGQTIGYTGYTGYTIPAGPRGCHLHFDVRGSKNPFAKY